jgi:CheY-like chemotaxis protein
MLSILIISDDIDVANLLSFVLDQAGYTSIHTKSVMELFQNLATFDFIILDHPFNLTPDEWNMLKKLKEADERKLPIAITNSPQTTWLQQKSKEVGIDMIFPYPCDLTVEIPTFLNAYFEV